MQAQQDLILSPKTIDTSLIVYDDIILTQNNQFAVAKIWYKPSNNTMHSLFYQTSTMPIYNYDQKNNKFFIKLNGGIDQHVLNEIDKLSINYIKSTNLVQRLALSPKSVKYRTVVQDFTNKEGEHVNSFELKNNTFTKYYSNGIKKSKTLDEVNDLLNKGINVKTIIEIDGLIVDIKKETITTNIVLHQFRIEKIIPKKIELCEYSFLESDDEVENESLNLQNNLTINNMTYEEENGNNNDKEENEEEEDEDEEDEEGDDEKIIINNEEDETLSEESEGNSYEEESSDDMDVEEFVSKLKETQKPAEVPKQQNIKSPPKGKRGRPAIKK